MFERPSRRFGRGRKSLPEVRERLGGPPEGPQWVGRDFRRPERGRESLPKVQEGSGGPPGGSGGPRGGP